MSFAVRCARCRLEFSGRAPLRAAAGPGRPRYAAAPGRDRALLPHRRARRSRSATRPARSATTCASRATRARFRDHFLVPIAAAIWSPSPARMLEIPARLLRPVLRRTTACSASAATVAHGRRRQPALRRRDHGAPRARLRLRAGVRAVTARRRRRERADRRRRRPPLRRRRDRPSHRRRRSRCWPIRATWSATCSARSHTRNEHGAPHRRRACCRDRAAARAVVELPRRRLPRALGPADRHLLPQQAAAPATSPSDYCVSLNRDGLHRGGPGDRARRLRAPALHVRLARGKAPAAAARRAAAHLVLRRVPRLRLPRGRARARACARRPALRGAVVRSALYDGHAACTRARARAQRLPLPGLLLAARPRRAAGARPPPGALRLQPRATSSTFRDADHLGGRPAGQATTCRTWPTTGSTWRAAASCCSRNLRLFGYVFNPVSYFYCCARRRRARGVVAEVGNTFGERHPYLLAEANRVARAKPAASTSTTSASTSRRSSGWTRPTASCSREPGESVHAGVGIIEERRARRSAPCSPARRRPLTNARARAGAVALPADVPAGDGRIHWQAVKLALRGCRSTASRRSSPARGRMTA